MSKHQAIIDLATDLSNGCQTYSVAEANEKLRKAINEVIGCEDGKFDYRKLRRHQVEVFEILEEALDRRLEEGLKGQFDAYVDFRSVAFGDKIAFVPQNNELFRVDAIAGGNNNLRRQRIAPNQPYTIPTGWYGVKFYDELERFLSGRVDWAELVARVERSFTNKISEDIFAAIKSAYSALGSPYKATGTFDADKMADLVDHVRAATGLEPMVIGTAKAVRKAVPAFQSDAMKGERNANGYFKVVDGIQYGIIPQAHKIGTDEFAIDDNFLLVLPNGDEKIVKMVTEGNTLIKAVRDQENADDSETYTMRKKYGVGVEKGAKYGVYSLS